MAEAIKDKDNDIENFHQDIKKKETELFELKLEIENAKWKIQLQEMRIKELEKSGG